MRREIDFTQGSILRAIVLFSTPIVMGELLQNLYSSVDALVVGNFVSDSALAAVTVSSVISTMVVNFFNGMSVGSNVAVSRSRGAEEKEALRRTIRIAFSLSVLMGVALSLLGILLTPQLLAVAGAQESYYREALNYLRLYLAGIAFTVIYNSGAGILRAMGDSRTPFLILASACGLNVALDILLVATLRMGVVGAALATVLAQMFSVVCVVAAIRKQTAARCLDFRELVAGVETVRAIMDIGIAAGMQSALIGFSNIFVVRYMNLFSTEAVAGIGIAQRLDRFVILPIKSFGITMTTYVSQNLGARHYERIRIGVKHCLLASLCVTLTISLLVFVFARQCVAIFDPNEAVVSVGTAMVRILAPFLWTMGLRESLLGILRGYGKARVPMLLCLIGMVGFRQLFLAVSMSQNVNIFWLYTCYPVAWLATITMVVAYFFAVRRDLPGLGKEVDS